MRRYDEKLFAFLSLAVDRRLSDFKAQDAATTAWAFATVKQSDEKLFASLARAAERCVSSFTVKNLANAAWAFAKVCHFA